MNTTPPSLDGSQRQCVQISGQTLLQNAAPAGGTIPLRRGVGLARPSQQHYTQPNRGCRCCQWTFLSMLAWEIPLNANSNPPVTTVMDIVGAEPNLHRPPRKNPSTLPHPLPTDSFLNPAPAALPVCACLRFCRFCPDSAPPAFPRCSCVCSRLRSCLCSFLSSRVRSPPFSNPCRSPRHELLRSDLITGQVVWRRGYCGS